MSRRTRRRGCALLITGFVALVCVASVAQTSARASTSAVSMPPNTLTAVTPSPPTGVQLTPVSPAPSASPPPNSTSPGTGSTWVAPWDIPGLIGQAITGWFSSLAISALNPLLDLLGTTVLATPDVTQPGRVSELWGVAAAIANSLLVLLIIAGGVLVMTHETLQTRYSVKEIAPRIAVAAVAANASLAIAGVAIRFCNALAQALLGQGVDPASAIATLRSLIEAPLASGGIFLVLLGLVLAVLAVILIVVYIVRVALVVLVVAAAPLALICHAWPPFDGMAQLWWRGFIALLAIQLGQSFVLVTALRVFLATGSSGATFGLFSGSGLVDLLVTLCLFWVLIKIPSWASRAVFNGRGSRGGTVRQIVRTVVELKVVRAITAAL